MGEIDELIMAQGPDPAVNGVPGSAAKVKNDTAALSEGGLACAVQTPSFVVGIRASAGGHEPLEHIFTAVPVDCNLSFVVVMHVPAEGPSLLTDLIRRYTSMEVLTAEDGMPLLPNTVHVIPPGVTLTVKEGKLRLDPGEVTGRTHHPIDRFFTSLAADYGARAIAVVSGFGLDGCEGVKRVKEAGGIVLVQEPGTAVNSPMPRNAIATGAVDIILPMEDIPAKIAEIARGESHLPQRACLTTTLDEELHTLFTILKARTGHDFSSYKRNTILRRIERRMTVNNAGGIRKYLAILEENPHEAQALCQEILIGVTSFFRDPEAFELLRSEIVPRLFADRDPEDPVRIWHACCATGEEAYSVAMLIQEHLEKESRQARVQIFATDIDEAAVAQARAGLYPDDIGPEVGEERLKSFFTRSDGRWQVAKRLREMIVFAHHSIIKDPPFSRLDLLVCRNFLIYLDPEMQKRLIFLFHMVLKPGGFLFLGAAETVGRNSELFTAVDKKWKIFQRLESGRREETFFPFSSPMRKLARTAPPKRPAEVREPTPAAVAESLLVERYSPPCVIVNEKYEVLHISTRTQRYMEVPVGEPTLDILRMAREELRPALRAAIYKAFTEQKQVAFRGVKMAVDAGEAAVNVLVEPLAADPVYGKLVIVILEPAPSPAVSPASAGGEALPGDESSKDMLIRQLEEQLRITHEQLQATSEQLETSNEGFLSANEELMSINEEFQSTNEELQSTNEELETSKEELQALNEELVTVNSELQGKMEELNQSNSDMENLFASSEIAAIFLDRGLIIKRFSPAMAAIFNLIPADIGRTFRHLAGTIDWSDLPRDSQAVLEKLTPVEREVTALVDGRIFIMRVLPYRTKDGRIDGVVVTLIDITLRKRAEEEQRRAKEEWERTFASVPDLITILDNEHRVLRVNEAMARRLGLKPEECVGLSCYEAVHGTSAPPASCPHLRTIEDGGEHIEELHVERLGGDFLVTTTPLLDAKGERLGSVHIARDITERKRAEEALEAAHLAAVQEKSRLEAVMEALPVGVAILDSLGGNIRSNRAFEEVWGGPRPLPRTLDDYADFKAWWVETGQRVQPEEWASSRAVRNDESLIGQLLRIERFDGTHAYIHNSAAPFHDPSGRITGCAVAVMDITEQIETQETLELTKEAAEAANRAKSQFLANMSHELRTPMTGVLGMLEFTLNTSLDAQQRDFIETARNSARTLLRILNDILDLSKVEAGKLSIEVKPFALRDCVDGAIDILVPEARRKGLELNCAMADDLPKTVVGDQVRLLQVLTNLCGNAVKFTDQGKVEVKVTRGGETTEGKREITFSVEDTGIGIPDDKKELIFGSFNQADISHARRYGGTGLGLAICRELVERMGGTITCISEEGKGSTFSFTILLEEALTESETVYMPIAPPPAECAPVSSSEMIKARLLLAEDDPITRQVVGLMLKYANFDHEIAENGLRAVEMWEKGNYDLILMDVQMPVLDGFAATGAIREKERANGGHTLIVAMTAHAFPEDEKRCLDAGMDAYIPKPIDLQKCIATIEELIGKRDRETYPV
jgi:two-component system CheB/CheR fusion protein